MSQLTSIIRIVLWSYFGYLVLEALRIAVPKLARTGMRLIGR